MIEKAYAKINLSLNIKDKREDGYHDLESIMLPIELHDTIDITIEKSQKEEESKKFIDYLFSDESIIVIIPTMLPVIKDNTKTGTIKKLISGKLNKYFDKKA